MYLYTVFCKCKSVFTVTPRHQTITVPGTRKCVCSQTHEYLVYCGLDKISMHKLSEHCKCMSCVSLMWTAAVNQMCRSLITLSLHISTSTYLRASIILHLPLTVPFGTTVTLPFHGNGAYSVLVSLQPALGGCAIWIVMLPIAVPSLFLLMVCF